MTSIMKKLIALLVMMQLLLSIIPLQVLAQRHIVVVSSYRATVAECGKSNGITASGVHVTNGIVASDWNVFPPGTVLYCEETGEVWVAADKGGAIHGCRIDRFVHYWKPGLWKGGALHAIILYRPQGRVNRNQVRNAVYRGLYLRQCLLKSGIKLSSRSGRIQAQMYIKRTLGNKPIPEIKGRTYRKHARKHTKIVATEKSKDNIER
jgi:3D (Asp-Asp-Asp) domain-containing protein